MLKNFKVLLIVTFILGAFNSFAQRGCAPAGSGLNVSSTPANNVPVGLCYINTVGECLYNTSTPTTSGAWNTGCPEPLKSRCCKPNGSGADTGAGANQCPPPSIFVSSPFTQLTTNPAYANLYDKCKQEAGQSPNPSTYRCCVNLPAPKDPCKERGLQQVNAASFNLSGGVLCCNSANARTDLANGSKVCCEFVKNGPN
jgi:hypothetical protein